MNSVSTFSSKSQRKGILHLDQTWIGTHKYFLTNSCLEFLESPNLILLEESTGEQYGDRSSGHFSTFLFCYCILSRRQYHFFRKNGFASSPVTSGCIWEFGCAFAPEHRRFLPLMLNQSLEYSFRGGVLEELTAGGGVLREARASPALDKESDEKPEFEEESYKEPTTGGGGVHEEPRN
ncbi:hypothetical protein CRE_00560 [Caenorhabditis remanei]|uniref:Uncharacterized protein n=1 Tax=Caenorhabditis remanei TaxID=31234 RepID=E3LD42_CAERE|nr:hypothetical protein CRE_00560 [Caenorhabditis remanei]